MSDGLVIVPLFEVKNGSNTVAIGNCSETGILVLDVVSFQKFQKIFDLSIVKFLLVGWSSSQDECEVQFNT